MLPDVQSNFLRRAFTFAADLIYPPRCPFCDAFAPSRLGPCERCEPLIQRLQGDAHIELAGRVWLSRARSCFAYDGRVRDALQAMKYSKRLDLIRYFGLKLAEDAAPFGDFERITCVPMSNMRLRGRGYNPSAILAQAVAAATRTRLDLDALSRARDCLPQVGLPRQERVRNVAHAFEVPPARRWHIEKTRVLLIDDVLTTGATANDCARALIKAGAGEVCALTVARAL